MEPGDFEGDHALPHCTIQRSLIHGKQIITAPLNFCRWYVCARLDRAICLVLAGPYSAALHKDTLSISGHVSVVDLGFLVSTTPITGSSSYRLGSPAGNRNCCTLAAGATEHALLWI